MEEPRRSDDGCERSSVFETLSRDVVNQQIVADLADYFVDLVANDTLVSNASHSFNPNRIHSSNNLVDSILNEHDITSSLVSKNDDKYETRKCDDSNPLSEQYVENLLNVYDEIRNRLGTNFRSTMFPPDLIHETLSGENNNSSGIGVSDGVLRRTKRTIPIDSIFSLASRVLSKIGFGDSKKKRKRKRPPFWRLYFNKRRRRRPPVLIHHGLFASSANFVLSDAHEGALGESLLILHRYVQLISIS